MVFLQWSVMNFILHEGAIYYNNESKSANIYCLGLKLLLARHRL